MFVSVEHFGGRIQDLVERFQYQVLPMMDSPRVCEGEHQGNEQHGRGENESTLPLEAFVKSVGSGFQLLWYKEEYAHQQCDNARDNARD